MTSVSISAFDEEPVIPQTSKSAYDILFDEMVGSMFIIDPCIMPDNGFGTVDLPASCPYEAPVEPFFIIDGLPPGTTMELDPIFNAFESIVRTPGGMLGGEILEFDSTLQLDVTGTGDLTGFHRILSCPVSLEVHTGPRNPGDPVQTFASEIFQLQGEIFGDPDFCTFIIRAGSDYGLPSPGQFILTELPSSNYNIDSFFDITYQIEFEGCPGSIIEGYMGATVGTTRLQQGTEVTNTPPNTPGTPTGPTTGVTGISYNYQMSTTDPDNDQVKYGMDFDNDGVVDPSHWTSFHNSGQTINVALTFGGTGTYYLSVKAEDTHGAQSGFSPYLTVVISTGTNNPPNAVIDSISPNPANQGQTVTFTGHGTDPDTGDTITGYNWRSTIDGQLNTASSFSSSTLSAGTHTIYFKVQDNNGAWSTETSQTLTINAGSNNPPNKPSTPSGSTSGKINTQYQYSTSTTDPDGNAISYLFDWGDGTDSGWTDPVPSGEAVTETHEWSDRGNYQIKVKARDVPGFYESEWSDPLPVSMPKNKQYTPFGIILTFGFDVDVKIVQLEPGEDYIDLEVLSKPFYIWENEMHIMNSGAFIRLYSAKGFFSPSVPICFGICEDWGIIG